MKPAPAGWPRISSSLYYVDAAKAIDWLCEAFGFEVQLKVENDRGEIEHSELKYGDGLVMVGQAGLTHKAPYRKAPREVAGANTQNMMVFVDDAKAHCERARTKGGKIVAEPSTHDYGEDYWADLSYECEDIEGHHWWFCQRLRSKPA